MLLLDRGVNCLQLAASLFEGCSGSQAAKELGHAVHAARNHCRREMMWAGDDVGDDFGVLRIRDAGLEHTDYRCNSIAKAAELNSLTEDRRIFVERVCPETIGENRNACCLGAVVLRTNKAPKHRMKTHHIKVGSADHARADFAGLAQPDHRETDHREVAEFTEALDAVAQILELGN